MHDPAAADRQLRQRPPHLALSHLQLHGRHGVRDQSILCILPHNQMVSVPLPSSRELRLPLSQLDPVNRIFLLGIVGTLSRGGDRGD